MVWTFQSNMTKGELDPQLAGRIDLAAYYNGLETATNVLCIPQGGVKKRPGTEYLDTVADGRLESFSFSTEQNFLMVFTNGQVEVFKDGVSQDTVALPYNLAAVSEFDYIQSADTIIITHEDHPPRNIVRVSDTNWTSSLISLVNIPQFDFDDGSSPTPVDEVQDVNIAGMAPGSTIQLSLEGFKTEEFSYEGANADMAEAIENQLLALRITGTSGVAVVFSSGTDANATFRVTFSGASANDWRLITGLLILGPITGNEIISTTRISTGTSRSEDTWSTARGWPRTLTFHENRLWFGGSRSRVSTVWASVVGSFFNFNEGTALDDQSIEVTLDTDQVNAIQGIFSNRTLQIFTTGAEFQAPESPLTPSGIAIKPQTNLGSKRVRPVNLSGATIFIQRTGKALNQFIFSFEQDAFDTSPLSVLSPHLINNPVQMAIKQGTESSDANYIYLVNDDGKLTVFNSLPQEGVAGFTSWETDGLIKSVAVVDDELNLLVERVVNSVTVYYLEKENLLLNTDSAVRETGIGGDTLTGLTHLNTETVKVKADGSTMDDEVVSGGQITINRDADTIEAGLEYNPTIVTMPVNIDLQGGAIAASKKRIKRAALELFESNGVIVNGEIIPDKTIGQDQFDAPEPQSGLRRVFLHGWSLKAQLTITQDTPMQMQILNIGLEVKT